MVERDQAPVCARHPTVGIQRLPRADAAALVGLLPSQKRRLQTACGTGETPDSATKGAGCLCRRYETREGVRKKRIRDDGSIRAQILSAAITGSDNVWRAFHSQTSLLVGRVTVKVEPFPTALSTVMIPP